MSQGVIEEKQSTMKKSIKLSNTTPIYYDNKHYASARALCNDQDLKYSTFRRKYKEGLPIEVVVEESRYKPGEKKRIQIRIKNRRKSNIKSYKYKNKIYKDKGSCVKAAGLSKRVIEYWNRIGIEITEDNIEKFINEYKFEHQARTSSRTPSWFNKPITFRGETYKSVNKLLTAYNKRSIIYTVSWDRSDHSKKDLITILEKSLEEGQGDIKRGEIEKQHFEGKVYNSFTQLCNAFNMDRNTVKTRMNNGMNLKDALTKDAEHTIRNIEVFDTVFNSKISLSSFFGVSMHALYKCDTDEKIQLQIEKKLKHDKIIENKVGTMYICKCPKCNRSVYVTENKMVEFIRHTDDSMCKQYELQEA